MTPLISDAGSCQLTVSQIRVRGVRTPRIGESKELFFEYEYLREFEAEVGTALCR